MLSKPSARVLVALRQLIMFSMGALCCGVVGLYAVGSSAYWHFMASLPESTRNVLGEFAFSIFKPVLVSDAAFAEEQLEFYEASLLVAAAYVAVRLVVSAVRRAWHASNSAVA